MPQNKLLPLNEKNDERKYAHDEDDELLMRPLLFYADMIDFYSTFSLFFFFSFSASFYSYVTKSRRRRNRKECIDTAQRKFENGFMSATEQTISEKINSLNLHLQKHV